MIEVKNLSFSYDNNIILDDVSFNLEKNSILGILGQNGAGKTTLLKCISKILKPNSGKIYIDNINLSRIHRNDIPKQIGYVPQYSHEAPLTVFDAVLLGRKPYIKYKSTNEDTYIVEQMLKYMNLDRFAFKFTNELSGGEFQKVRIARVLVREPNIILLDEPTNNLDLKSQIQIMDLIYHVAKKHNLTVILSVHDINLAFRYCDQLLLLKDNTAFKFDKKENIKTEMLENIYNIGLINTEFSGHKLFVPINKGNEI